MRTTIDLPDPVFRELKALAAQQGTSLKKVIGNAVEAELQKAHRTPGRRVQFPILKSKKPGVLNLTNAELEEFLA